MTNNRIIRSGTLVAILCTAALAGCDAPPSAMPSLQQSMVPANTGPYSAGAWYTDLDTVMTSTSGGD